jgi:dihydrofolate reductase
LRVSYYVAASLDGFIAGPDGDVDWLDAADLPDEDFGYEAFVETVDALIMGRKTWDFVAGVRPWPYGARPVRVFSHRSIDPRELPVERAAGEASQVVAELAEAGHAHVWLVGGGGLASALVASGHLTDLILTVIPVTLGRGIPLFGDGHDRTLWRPRGARRWSNGVVQHHFSRNP